MPPKPKSVSKRNWVVDPDQEPDTLIERHRAVAASPEVHAAFARNVRDKAEKFGVIHIDTNSGYRARFPIGKPPAELDSDAA